MEDTSLYPEFGGPRKAREPVQSISIASTSSSSSSVAAPVRNHVPKPGAVIISSDEEDQLDDDDVVEIINESNKPSKPNTAVHPVATNMVQQQENRPTLPPKFPVPVHYAPGAAIPALPMPKNVGIPIAIPTYKDIPRFPQPSVPQKDSGEDGEEVHMPELREEYGMMSSSDAEKALRDLMGGAMNDDVETEVDMDEAIVEGFQDGIALLPHQILGRTWMRDREDLTRKRTGGILADDMGLGKTIQTLTRIVEGRPHKSDKEDGWSATTLVVCPLALVGQWADEIQKMTKLSVLKHHGANRTTDPSVLRKYRVVVTTYDTVKSEYESHSPSAKDESAAKKKTAKKAAVDSSDHSEHETFGRTIKKPAKKAAVKKCALYGVQWWRVVLDEAHNIKNVKTKGAIACCELPSKFRWCLTGTPMQNNVTELYSLLKFLRIKPLSNWDTFNTQIAKPVTSGRGAGRAMKRLQVVLKQVMLRRKKDDSLNGQKLIELPQRLVNIVSCPFNASEKAFYDGLENKMEHVIEKIMNTKGGNSYISVLLLLLRLRQACNHPLLVAKDYKNDIEAVEPTSNKGKDDKDTDPDDLAAAFGQLGVTRKCQMCTTVLDDSNTGEEEWKTHCVDCVPLAIQAKEAEEERPSSAKTRMILKLLNDIDERSDCEEKTIIFSQFTSMLDLIEPFLSEEGVKYVRYDGSMSAKEREVSLAKIKSSKSTRVILISFKAGSTGLNLTACNNVILVDLWWNPALEDQAFDRAHRFGQTRDVNIFKLKIDNTVEDRILALQDKKRQLAQAALSGDKIKNMRLGMDDLLALFRPGGRDDDEEDSD